MNKCLLKLVKHPMITLSNHVPVIRVFLSDYAKQYGLILDSEKKIYRYIKKEIRSTDYIMVTPIGDGRILYYLTKSGFHNIEGVDSNIKNITAFNRRVSGKARYADLLLFKEKRDVLICEYLLNSLKESDLERYLANYAVNFKKIFFFGPKVKAEQHALGPEPPGSYGCRQYPTDRLPLYLKKVYRNFVEVDLNDPRFYFYYIEQKDLTRNA